MMRCLHHAQNTKYTLRRGLEKEAHCRKEKETDQPAERSCNNDLERQHGNEKARRQYNKQEQACACSRFSYASTWTSHPSSQPQRMAASNQACDLSDSYSGGDHLDGLMQIAWRVFDCMQR